MKSCSSKRKNKRKIKEMVEGKLRPVQALSCLTLKGMKNRVPLMMFIWTRVCSNILYYVCVCRESKWRLRNQHPSSWKRLKSKLWNLKLRVAVASRVLWATRKLQATGCSGTELSLGVQQFGSTLGVSSFLTVLNNHINFHLFAYLEHSSHHCTDYEQPVLYSSSDGTSTRRQNWTGRLGCAATCRLIVPSDIHRTYHEEITWNFNTF